ncbi:MAG: radical SAM protein [Bdellovibrionota bacterium]
MEHQINIDGHKLDRHPREVARWLNANQEWDAIRDIYPIYVEISPFGGCNFRCSFCAKDFLKYKNVKIEYSLLRDSLSIMKEKGVKSVYFAGEGEPMLYEKLGEIFEHCARIGLDAALNTNGSISDPKIWRSAVENCKWIRASVNAGTAQEHSLIHKCREDVFEKVFLNLEQATATRKQSGSPCVIGAQVVLLDQNQSSVLQLARRCRSIGIDYLTIKPYSQHPESITRAHENTDYSNIDKLAANLKFEENADFKIHFRAQSFGRAATGERKYTQCFSTAVFWAYIRSNGDVVGCSNFMTDSHFNYGNLNQSSFAHIWEGEGRRAGFEYMRDSHDLKRCRINCRMDKANEYLWELAEPSEHANFI